MNIQKMLSKIKKKFKNLPENIAKKAFLVAISLLILGPILSIIIFYNYSIQAQKIDPEVPKELLQFNEEKLFKILDYHQQLQERKEAFNLEKIDPFNKVLNLL